MFFLNKKHRDLCGLQNSTGGMMSKKVYALLILIALTLTACAGQSSTANRVETNSSDQLISYSKSASASTLGDGLTTDFENAEPVITQLILGLIKLDGTKIALTKAQATAMLPIWEEYQTAVQKMMPGAGNSGENPADGQQPAARPTMDPNSTPVAPEENSEMTAALTALTDKMQALLSSDQINAIAEMKITRDIATTIMQEKNITTGGPDGQDGSGSQQGGTPPQQQDGGQQPPAGGQGGPQQGGQGGPQQGGQDGPQQGGDSGQMPGGMGGPGGGMLQPGLIQAFTELLEKISGAKSTVAFTPAGISPAGSIPGKPPQGNTGKPGENTTSVTYDAAYKLSGETKSISGESYTADKQNESAILVTDAGRLDLTRSKISTTGDTSSQDSSSFAGLNAAVLATGGSIINLSDSSIDSTGEGANGAFATESGSTVNLSNVVINASGGGGHGVMATKGGIVTLENVDIMTSGKNSGALATDRGSGTITAKGGSVSTSGADSPAIYSTGDISVSGGIYSATGAEAAVIEGGNTITLTDSILTTSMNNKWGVMIYQSMSGDAEGTHGTFTMTGGELNLTARKGPLFYVTNSTGIINLTGVSVSVNSGELIDAAAGRWGNEGSNGGAVILTASQQNLSGSIAADDLSSVDLNLSNSSNLKSTINPTHTSGKVNLTLDASSTWNVTANSYINCLSDDEGISDGSITNINGSGFTVYYNSAACPVLGAKTYTLNGGGSLTPQL